MLCTVYNEECALCITVCFKYCGLCVMSIVCIECVMSIGMSDECYMRIAMYVCTSPCLDKM